ncbi:methyltransferase domain protein [Ancylostoma duodenale]|uniref:Methyltransferase domain protein n=1 Tax=Ancylostoma duodenale TaxID=51022 RepID=A0A0C2D8I6_9BILA|nr:methyltransferase domain protein [Ancylostoma duodenale]
MFGIPSNFSSSMTHFNAAKERRLGCKLEPGKILRKTHKSWEQLKRHDPDVEISEEVTEHLFVSNSSVLCGVSLEELEKIFYPFDDNASFTVFPNKRSYSFVSFSSKEKAEAAREALHGRIPPQLKVSHQPFLISYVRQLPACKPVDNTLYPKDFLLVEDYITEDEEKAFLDLIFDTEDVKSLKHRAVIHYGHEFDYSKNAAFKPTKPIPPLINQLADRLVKDSHVDFRPDQVTINVYEPGQGIPSHYDTHSAFEDPIVCVRIVNRKHDINPLTHRVMPRRLRVSITLRKIRHEPCQCQYKEFCDWDREGEMAVPSDDKSALRIESQYVSGVYESIASHFDETRFSSWTGVKKFMNSLPPYSVVYDVGCGNGKYLLPNDGLIKIGCDMSQMLCEIVQNKGCMVVRADALSIPFREGADAVISIAVLHHMASLPRRKKMISEILRVLKAGGRACITVWSMDQSNSEYAKMRDNKDSVIEEAKKLDRLRVHDGKEFVQQDLLVPWRIDGTGETFMRYYHVFAEGEMEELLRSVGGCSIESIEKEQGNYIAVITKQ